MDLNTVSFVVGVTGITGVTALGLARRLVGFSRRNLFLRFAVNAPLDIVLSTSTVESSEEPVTYRRVLTSMGHLHTAAKFSEAVGEIKRREQVVIQACAEIDGVLDGDLVLIGGPAKNPVSGLFLDALNRAYPDLHVELEPADGGARIALASFTCDFTDETMLRGERNFLTEFGLIVAWINPFAVRRRRAILCAGVTSHGTAAAAAYFLGDFMKHRYSSLRRARPRGGPFARLGIFTWPTFALLLKVVTDEDGRFSVVEESGFALLRPPRRSRLPLTQPVVPDGELALVPATSSRESASPSGSRSARPKPAVGGS